MHIGQDVGMPASNSLTVLAKLPIVNIQPQLAEIRPQDDVQQHFQARCVWMCKQMIVINKIKGGSK